MIYVGLTSCSGNSDPEVPLLIARDQVARLRFLLTARLRVSPALNLAWVLAGSLIASPVCGLRPLRAARLPTMNLPKPDSRTSSPLARLSVMVVKTAVTARSALALLTPVMFTTASTRRSCCQRSRNSVDHPSPH